MSLDFFSYHGGKPLEVIVYDSVNRINCYLPVIFTFEEYATFRRTYRTDYDILHIAVGNTQTTLTLIKKGELYNEIENA